MPELLLVDPRGDARSTRIVGRGLGQARGAEVSIEVRRAEVQRGSERLERLHESPRER